MKIAVEVTEQATVAVSGAMTAGEDLDCLRRAIDDLLQRGHKHIVLDVSGVVSVDPAGFEEFTRAYTTLDKNRAR